MSNKDSEKNFLERKLTENFTYLQENISGVIEVVDKLIAKGVINFHDRSKFESDTKLQKDKIHDVLKEVITKRKFDEFNSALQETGHSHVVEILTASDEEFDNFISNPGTVDVSSSTKTIVELEAEKKKLEEDLDHLKTIQKKIREQLEEKTNRIDKLKKEKNNEKKQLEKDIQKLQEELKNLEEDFKKKTEYADKLKQQFDEVVDLNKKLEEQSKADRKQMQQEKIEREKDRVERENDRKEREKDREQRAKEIEQRDKESKRREVGIQLNEKLNDKMDLVLSKFEQQNINEGQDENSETSETNKTTQPPAVLRSNIAYNCRIKNSKKKI